MTRVGLELGAQRARAVVSSGWLRPQWHAVEVPFDPERPDEAVDALRALLGDVRRIAIAVDLQLLRTKRVTLPALPAVERRNILRLEPDRFFALRGEEVVVAIGSDDGLVFAATATEVARWVDAFERLAPVDVIEPTPVALARALATVSVDDALLLFDDEHAGVAFAEVRAQRVMYARRLFGRVAAELPATHATTYLDPYSEERSATFASLSPGLVIEALPAMGKTGTIAGAFAAAYGAALALEQAPPMAETLMSPAHETKVQRRRTRRLAIAAAACAAAFIFAVSSLDSRQDRVALALTMSSKAFSDRAAPAVSMQTELANLARRAEAMRSIDSERPDPLRMLRALSAALPAGAFVRQIRGAGSDWQVDGYAPNASAVLTALGGSTEFHDAHFLSGTNHAQIANRPYESFALAFRYSPTS